MKKKTAGRILGTLETYIAGNIGYHYGNMLSRVDYEKSLNFFLGDYPIEQKIYVAAALAVAASAIPVMGFLMVDGLVGVVKGTPYYVSLKAWKKLSRNEETKKSIDEGLENYVRTIEEPLSIEKPLF
jgi:hypothetical protein